MSGKQRRWSFEVHSQRPGVPQLIRSLEDLRQRESSLPAFVEVPSQLVGPVHRLVRELVCLTPRGQLARGLEQVLIGMDDTEPSLLAGGAREIVQALFRMGVLTLDQER